MSFSIEFADDQGAYDARIKVIGVGGSGGNAVNHMVTTHVQGVDFISIIMAIFARNSILAASRRRVACSRLFTLAVSICIGLI